MKWNRTAMTQSATRAVAPTMTCTNSAAISPVVLMGALMALSTNCRADEFMAQPGLWKTTTQSAGVNSTPAQVDWHCVDEAADPWSAFAQLEDVAGASCTRTTFERTATSLKWKLDCSAPWPLRNQGAIVFDSPSHYSGSVTLSGVLMNYPIADVIHVEGQRYAACTSPSD